MLYTNPDNSMIQQLKNENEYFNENFSNACDFLSWFDKHKKFISIMLHFPMAVANSLLFIFYYNLTNESFAAIYVKSRSF